MPPDPGGDASGIYVLFVDDDEDARVVMKAMLEFEGVIVETAGSVSEALARLGTILPDVIITDLRMPPRDGFAFLEELKKSPARAIPVIAFTGVTGREREVGAAGFADLVVKPVDPMTLIAVITRVLARPKQ
jgi:CheY-like chemotaxis protein